MKHLKVSKDLSLPLSIANKTICLFGKGGSGKSNLEVVLAEELYAAGIPTCIVDPADVHYGIKSARDGKSAGLPFIVFGGLHADVPIYPENGVLLADLFLDRGLYMVIVTQPWTGRERSKFMTDFANRLYQRGPEKEQRGSARVLMLEEAHEYVPLQPAKGEEVMLGAMKRLYTVGRNYWIGFIAATRRPARLHTDLRNGADATAFFQIVGTQDRKAMTDYLGEMAEKDVRDEIVSHVAKLPVGTAYFYQPHETPVLQRVHFRYRNTLDTTTTEITAGHKAVKPVLAEVDLSKLGKAMEDAREKAKADDPKELRKTINELRAQVRKFESARSQPTVEPKTKVETKTIEKKVVIEATVTRLEKLLERGEKLRDSLQDGVAAINEEVNMIAQSLNNARKINEPFQKPEPPPTTYSVKVSRLNSATGARSVAPPPSTARITGVSASAGRDFDRAQSNGDLTKPEQRVLDSLAWWEAIGVAQPDKGQVGFIAGYRVGKNIGGTYGNLLGSLRTRGYLDYPSPGAAALTDEGRKLARFPPVNPTLAALHEAVCSRLSNPEVRVLEAIMQDYPNPVAKQEAGARAGYTVGDNVGGTFGNILGKLRSLGLIDYVRGQAIATELLFPPGLN